VSGQRDGRFRGVNYVRWRDNKGDESVQKLKRSLIGVVGAAVLTMGVVATTAVPAMAYSPGTATPSKPKYDSSTDSYKYSCSFARWRSGAKVTWHCNLFERRPGSGGGQILDTYVRKNKGSWTPGSSSYKTSTFSRKKVLGEASLCVEAYALSVDGGTSSRSACT
jgi:hypothetical protein